MHWRVERSARLILQTWASSKGWPEEVEFQDLDLWVLHRDAEVS